MYAHLCFTSGNTFLAKLINPASLGVRTFFVLSGFLITTILLKEKERTGSISLKQFYYRRSLRIVPAYYVFLLCVFLLSAFGVIALERSDYFYTLTYTFNLKGLQPTWWVGHTWSLAIEEQFYLLWPLIVALFRKETLLRIASLCVVVSPVGRVLLQVLAPGAYGRWYLALPFVFDSIAIGAVLSLLLSDENLKSRIRLGVSRVWFWIAPMLIIASESLHNRPNFFPHPLILSGFLEPLTNICLALLVARVVLKTDDVFSKFMNSPLLVAIGVLSYSLYLWHMLFINPQGVGILKFPFNLIFASAAAIACYLFVERPFNELRRKRANRSPGVTLPEPQMETT